MLERNVTLEIERAYADLKALLLKKGCRIFSEEPSVLISAKQGSLWGISPMTAKKVVNYRFKPFNSETRITYSSALTSDWKNLTMIGTALAVLIASLCWWIATDLDLFVTTQQPSFWSWITTVDGYTYFEMAKMFGGLARVLAIFLAIIITLEMVIVVYANHRINVFAEAMLNALDKRSLK